MRRVLVVTFVMGALLSVGGADARMPPSQRAQWRLLGEYRVTGYCPCARCCGKSDGITADGVQARTCPERIVAAPKEFPFGTRLWIAGVGIVTVHDRGGAINGHRLDLFFRSQGEARRWGVQERSVCVWTGGVASTSAP